jgi:UDP-glucose 4-epimerase
MNILVTGGAGYIGSIFVEAALDAGHRVAVYDNLSEGHRAAVDPRATFILGELADETSLRQAMNAARPDAIVHFAARALVEESMTHPGKYFQNNVGHGVCLLEAALGAGVGKIVFSSTCAVYGMPDRLPMTEELPLDPVSPYGESKRMFERILGWYRQLRGLEYVAFRYFNAAGASARCGEHHRVETHLIPNVLKVALGQASHCELYGTDYPTPDGTCIRDYIHVRDLAQAHLLAIQPGVHGCFNLGNGAGYSVREVIETCRRITGHPIPAIEKPRRPGDPPRLVAAADKAARELGWRPEFPALDVIIDSAWRWHRSHSSGYDQVAAGPAV